MSGRRRILFRVARAMISDDAIVSGLVLALMVTPMSGENRGTGCGPYAALLFNSE